MRDTKVTRDGFYDCARKDLGVKGERFPPHSGHPNGYRIWRRLVTHEVSGARRTSLQRAATPRISAWICGASAVFPVLIGYRIGR